MQQSKKAPFILIDERLPLLMSCRKQRKTNAEAGVNKTLKDDEWYVHRSES
jgi:hypothetical protein